MIDISKFLIINLEQFNQLINTLNLNLTASDSEYLLTYLYTNFMAYIIIYLFIRIVMFCYFQIFSSKRRVLF